MNSARPRLMIVCGLPGAGKTTLAKRLEGEYPAIRLSADDWMDALSISLWDGEKRAQIEALQWGLAQSLLVQGQNVVIEWGSWSRAERDVMRLGARAIGAAVELRYVSAPPEVLFDRVQRRDRENPPIGEDEVRRWFEVLEEPTPGEIALYDPPLVP